MTERLYYDTFYRRDHVTPYSLRISPIVRATQRRQKHGFGRVRKAFRHIGGLRNATIG